jgi:hypothetical protein
MRPATHTWTLGHVHASCAHATVHGTHAISWRSIRSIPDRASDRCFDQAGREVHVTLGRTRSHDVCGMRPRARRWVSETWLSLTSSFCLIFFHPTRVGEALPAYILHHKHHAVVLLIRSTTPPHLAGPRRRSRRCAVRVQHSEAPSVVALGSDRIARRRR